MKALAGVITLARTFLDAFVLLQFWMWFIRPLGAPEITYAWAYGLDLCVGYVGSQIVLTLLPVIKSAKQDEGGEDALTQSLGKVLYYGFALLVGFITHLVIRGAL